MQQNLRIQVVSEGNLAQRLLCRSLEKQNGVELEKTTLRIEDLKNLTEDQRPDLFVVSFNSQREELTAVIQICKGMDHPALVFSSLLPDPDYVVKLKQLGAFEVIEKTAPDNAGDSYYRYLGTKISVLSQGAVTQWKRKSAKPQIVAHMSNSNKLPLTGIPAKIVVAIGLEGQNSLPLVKLLHDMNRLPDIAFVVAHRITDERLLKKWASELNEQSGYHVAVAGHGSPVYENSVLLAPVGKVLMVHGKKAALDEADEKDSDQLFDFLFDSAGSCYHDRSVGAIIGGLPQNGHEGMEKMRSFGGVSFHEIPDNEKPTHFSNNRRMPFPLLVLMLRRHLQQLKQ
ncbi:MAG: chemotaxis protein CheB [Myxococcales bacterium]|nr:chemotaxis protein CheB [Myxococcales bacterium]